jgi:hypothetical protein
MMLSLAEPATRTAAAEQRDELAALHSINSSARMSIVDGIERPRVIHPQRSGPT